MSQAIEQQEVDWIRALFQVLWNPSTYLKILYLLISFPLGIFYFVFLITGFALGLGLAIIWIGLPILLLVILAIYGLTGFERQLTIHMLEQPISPLRQVQPEESAWLWLKGVLTTPATWKGLLFLLLKFPLGIFSFVVTVTSLAISLSFLLAPLLILTEGVIDIGFWCVDTFAEALLCSLLGAILHVAVLHLLTALRVELVGAVRSGDLVERSVPDDAKGRRSGRGRCGLFVGIHPPCRDPHALEGSRPVAAPQRFGENGPNLDAAPFPEAGADGLGAGGVMLCTAGLSIAGAVLLAIPTRSTGSSSVVSS